MSQNPTLQCHVSTSIASSLDRLPLELLHMICASLDFQTLSRLSCTTLRNKATVESLPAYRDFMKYAPHTLSALAKTRLIAVHSSAKFHANLRSANCVSCGKYGAFLFLPTCERCCNQCLWRNQSLWVIPESVARKCFDLTTTSGNDTSHVQHTRRVLCCPYISRRGRQRLLSVKSVKNLAISVHGSEDKVAKLVPAKPIVGYPGISVALYYKYKWLLEAPLKPFSTDPSKRPREEKAPNDEWHGTASIHFPSLSPPNSVEAGNWCYGCKHTSDAYRSAQLSSHMISEIVPPGFSPYFWFQGTVNPARSTSEHLHHIQHCYGVQQLIARGDNNYY
ncbi:hypothetical protein DPV78_010583 [Talaromyces pinophilus]|nr:hypothetical protein DPV78_010583 [Talaromyces pinophilus]